MDYFEITERIIDYIEDNLQNNIELDAIAEETNFSLMQVYRIFSIVTGMTLKEYIRTRRLTKSLFEVMYSKESIINIALDSGYSSHEAFSRAFKKHFRVLPIQCRRQHHSRIISYSKPDIMKRFIHRASHEALDKGLYEKKNIDVFFATKPSMKFIGKINTKKLDPSKFYEYCIKDGIEDKFSEIRQGLFCCGACLNKPRPYDMHMFAIAVSDHYNEIIPKGLQAVNIKSSEYAVFYHNQYSTEEHGSVISSAWQVANSFKPMNFGYEFNFHEAPVIEIDDELGYFLHIPVKKINKSNISEEGKR